MREITGIQIDVKTWERLNAMKKCGDTFDEIVNRLIDENIEYKLKIELLTKSTHISDFEGFEKLPKETKVMEMF